MEKQRSFRDKLAVERLKDAIRRWLRPEPPEDPYSYVTARRKPRPGGRSAAAVIDEPDN